MNKEIVDKLFEINNQLIDIENLVEILTKYCELSEEDCSKITVLLLIIQKQIRLIMDLQESLFGMCKCENYSPK